MTELNEGSVEALWARAVFSPVPVRNAFEVTVERLAQGIRLGVLVGGDRLPPERELADTFGVSRVTLREAIKALRDAGLVESHRGRGGGTFVVAPKTHTPRRAEQIGRSLQHVLDDALDLRRIIEPGAAALAASRSLTAADRATLHRCLEEATNCSPETRRLADSRLHMAIAAAGRQRVGHRRRRRRAASPGRVAARHPGHRGQHRALGSPARRDRRCDPRRAERARPGRDGGAHRRDGGPAPRLPELTANLPSRSVAEKVRSADLPQRGGDACRKLR